MRLTRQRRQLLVIGAILLVAISGGALGASVGVFDQSLQATAYDFMLNAAGDRSHEQVTIVAIDDDTIQRYGGYPLPRRAYADAVKALAAYEPRVIGFDVGFYDPAEGDDALAAEMKRAGNVILAMQGAGVQTPIDGALRFQALQFPIQTLRQSGVSLAHVNVYPELDGRVRGSPLVVTDGTERYYALPFVAAARQLNLDLSTVRREARSVVVHGEQGDREIPVDFAGEMSIYFVAKPATPLVEQKRTGHYPCKNAAEICVISLSDVVAGRPAPDDLRKFLAKRIVLVGAHSASALPDNYFVPRSESYKMFGVEIWANVAQTIINGRFPLRRDDTLPTVFWLALVTIAGVALIVRFRIVGFFLALGVLVAYAVVALTLFGDALQLAPPRVLVEAGVVTLLNTFKVVHAPSLAYVAAGAPFWWVVVILYLQLEEQVSVSRTQRAFGLAVTPEVAKHILEMQDTGQLALGGHLRAATVLFGDIRGFTTISEGMGPVELMGTLNRYFGGMVQIVQKWGGTVNKYNGDNIMVIWGAPIPVEDHAKRAVQCALELQQFIVAERAKGGPDVAFGFGINTGELIAGFLGAQGRFEYTVIGDTVNVASRLTSGDIARRDNVAVSEGTLRALVPDVDYVDLGRVQVKGRGEPVHCYQVNRVGNISTPNPAPSPEAPINAPAVAGYH